MERLTLGQVAFVYEGGDNMGVFKITVKHVNDGQKGDTEGTY
jgi:hypothetical protein